MTKEIFLIFWFFIAFLNTLGQEEYIAQKETANLKVHFFLKVIIFEPFSTCLDMCKPYYLEIENVGDMSPTCHNISVLLVNFWKIMSKFNTYHQIIIGRWRTDNMGIERIRWLSMQDESTDVPSEPRVT